MKTKEGTENREQDEQKYREKLEILQKAKDIAGRQLAISVSDGSLKELDELKELINSKMEDPSQKYELYYNGIQSILRKYLPKGDQFDEERQFIYDEKNIFLTRGKAKDKNGRRGADGRMTYNEDLKEMVEVIAKWLMEGQDMVSLYRNLYELNEKHGYGHQYYDESSPAFQKAMAKTKTQQT